MLKIENLSKRFGGLAAVKDVTFTIDKGDILGLIGPNGAGKTTIVNMITGRFRPTDGNIYLGDIKISEMKPYQIASLGVGRTFQMIRLFEDLTLLDNVMAGMHMEANCNILHSLLWYPIKESENNLKTRAEELLEFVGLKDKTYNYVSSLTYGQRRMLDLARLLATKADVLLLDEPSAGLNSAETEVLRERLIRINSEGKTILLIEHDMNLVMNTCNRIVVLNNGAKLTEGTPREIQNNQEVIEIYLGSSKEGQKCYE